MGSALTPLLILLSVRKVRRAAGSTGAGPSEPADAPVGPRDWAVSRSPPCSPPPALRLPHFGAPYHPYGDRAVAAALTRHTANVISSVNFDLRAFDTLGEETILFGAVLGTVVLLRQTRDEREVPPRPRRGGPRRTPLRADHAPRRPPVAACTSSRTASSAPAAVSRAGWSWRPRCICCTSARDYRALERIRPIGSYEVGDAAGEAAYLVLGVAGLLGGSAFLANTLLPYGTFNTLASGGTVPLLNAAVGMEVACAVVVLLARFLDQARRDRGGRRRRRAEAIMSGSVRPTVMSTVPYLVAGWIFLVGCYGLATSRHLVHAVGCLTVCQSSTYVLLLAVGYRNGGTAAGLLRHRSRAHGPWWTPSCRPWP